MSRLADSAVQLDGRIHPDFHAVEDALRAQLASFPGGAAVCVYHRNECVVDLWGGVRNSAGELWHADTMAPSFSTTKGVASTLLHIMADRGLVDYDERVVKYWPEFGREGKEAITIRQVLCHQSGLYHIRQMIDRAERMLDWDHMVGAIEYARPAHPPGERTGYHGLTYGYLVGEIIQRVTGECFADLVQKEIARPLGLDGLYIGAPDAVLNRAAELLFPPAMQWVRRLPLVRMARPAFQRGSAMLQRLGIDADLASIFDALAPRGISSFDFGSPETLRAAIPAGNGLFTARSLARMYAALANGGELDGVRLMSPLTVRRASHLEPPTGRHAVIPFDMRWRLGYHSVITTRGVPRSAFGHFGFGGSGAWADPERKLAVALIVNSGIGTPFGDLRTARISGAALASVARRRPDWRSQRALPPRVRVVRGAAAKVGAPAAG